MIGTTQLYAGYGALRNPEMMTALLGDEPPILGPGRVFNAALAIQRLKHIPDTARDIVADRWQDKRFRSYALMHKTGYSTNVTVYEVTHAQRDAIADWEVNHAGWHENTEVAVRLGTIGNVTATVDTIVPGQSHDYPIGVAGHDPFLMGREASLEVAARVREQYLGRLAQQ